MNWKMLCPEKYKDLPHCWQEECEHSIAKSSDFSWEADNPDVCVWGGGVQISEYRILAQSFFLFSPLHCVGQIAQLWATNLQISNLHRKIDSLHLMHAAQMCYRHVQAKSGRPSQPSGEEGLHPHCPKRSSAFKPKGVHFGNISSKQPHIFSPMNKMLMMIRLFYP